jgi:Tol biopolymer transport system component
VATCTFIFCQSSGDGIMTGKRVEKLLIGLTLLLLPSVSVAAASDWGIKGVADTTKVSNIVQLTTTEASGQSFLAVPYGYPLGNKANIQPWRRDSQWITFSSEVDGTGEGSLEVCKIKADGSEFTRLTNNSGYSDSNASFSIDDMIYYNGNTLSSSTPSYIDVNWRMDQDGTAKTNLSDLHSATFDERSIVISPDGSMIAYQNHLNSLTVSSADDPTHIKLNFPSVEAGQYSFSPYSNQIAFSASNNVAGTYVIYTDQLNGTNNSTPLANPTSGEKQSWPSWSPDGTKIAYLWRSGSAQELRIIDAADGTALKTLDTADTLLPTGWTWLMTAPASWSPDSKWLTYHKSYTGSGTPADPSYNAIFIINSEEDIPVPSQLTTGYHDLFPIWSPGGSQIVFQSGYYELSREDDTCSPCIDQGDILILNLIEKYGLPPFQWPMFMPAILKKSQ